MIGSGDATAGMDESSLGNGQSVKVAVNIRPLIASEFASGCQDLVTTTPGRPQVVVPPDRSFTFDHVYGGGGPPMSMLFEDCVLPLVEGFFQGYNATVLAYGQTGSGKTYTMGTGVSADSTKLEDGVTPRVMQTLFEHMEALSETTHFQIRVSLIEIHKDDVRDLLDPSQEAASGSPAIGSPGGGGTSTPPKRSNSGIQSEKLPISIRELPSGVSLVGVTETPVHSLHEMVSSLEHGLLFRSTGSHLMNARSSRSHAIFTITAEQRKRVSGSPDQEGTGVELAEDYLCAKMHLVDLAGSERIKRTKAEGARMQEGIHINKGLLALGNVISALGDEKKRREGGHVPYRDSKLTRLLQDSLGGNSRTVMIACVSPADSNLDETLNTLKYANRARNIQNKPMVNRLGDQTAAELRRLQQQVEILRAEVLRAHSGLPPVSVDEQQALRERVSFLEASNAKLRQGLAEAREEQRTRVQRAERLQARNEQLAAEVARAARSVGAEVQEELVRAGETEAQLRAQVEAVRRQAQAEIARVKAADAEFRTQFAALRDSARAEAESLWHSEAQLRAELAAAQERARADAKKLAAAAMVEKQLKAQLKAALEQVEETARKFWAAEAAGKALQEKMNAANEKARAAAKNMLADLTSLRSELALAQEKGRMEAERASEAEMAVRQLRARLDEAERWAQMGQMGEQDGQDTAVQFQGSSVPAGRETGVVEVPAGNQGLEAGGSVVEGRSQSIAPEILDFHIQKQQAGAEVAAAQERVRREQQRAEEGLASAKLWEQRAAEAQEKAAEIQWSYAGLEATLRGMEEDRTRAEEAKTREAESRVQREESIREEAERQSAEVRAELAVAKNMIREAARAAEEACQSEGRKGEEAESKNTVFAVKLIDMEDRLRSESKYLEAAREECSHLKAELAAAGKDVREAWERSTQSDAVDLQQHAELAMALERTTAEAQEADEAQEQLGTTTAAAEEAEDNAREAAARAPIAEGDRDHYKEAVLASQVAAATARHLSGLQEDDSRLPVGTFSDVLPSSHLGLAQVEVPSREQIQSDPDTAFLKQHLLGTSESSMRGSQTSTSQASIWTSISPTEVSSDEEVLSELRQKEARAAVLIQQAWRGRNQRHDGTPSHVPPTFAFGLDVPAVESAVPYPGSAPPPPVVEDGVQRGALPAHTAHKVDDWAVLAALYSPPQLGELSSGPWQNPGGSRQAGGAENEPDGVEEAAPDAGQAGQEEGASRTGRGESMGLGNCRQEAAVADMDKDTAAIEGTYGEVPAGPEREAAGREGAEDSSVSNESTGWGVDGHGSRDDGDCWGGASTLGWKGGAERLGSEGREEELDRGGEASWGNEREERSEPEGMGEEEDGRDADELDLRRQASPDSVLDHAEAPSLHGDRRGAGSEDGVSRSGALELRTQLHNAQGLKLKVPYSRSNSAPALVPLTEDTCETEGASESEKGRVKGLSVGDVPKLKDPRVGMMGMFRLKARSKSSRSLSDPKDDRQDGFSAASFASPGSSSSTPTSPGLPPPPQRLSLTRSSSRLPPSSPQRTPSPSSPQRSRPGSPARLPPLSPSLHVGTSPRSRTRSTPWMEGAGMAQGSGFGAGTGWGLGLEVYPATGSSASRLWGSAALGLHGTRQAPAESPLSSPVQVPSPLYPASPDGRAAMARERVAWEPYVFNRVPAAAVLKKANPRGGAGIRGA